MPEIKQIKLENFAGTVPATALENLYKDVKDIMGDNNITSNNITSVLLNLMQIVDGYDDIRKEQKKITVLSVINYLIEEQTDTDDDAIILKALVTQTLPDLITTFISLDKSEIAIKIVKGCSKLFACCK